jgi:hypothetical protein
MEDSRLSLVVWFRAIRQLLVAPESTATDLVRATGHSRPATLRTVAARIENALKAENASERLAGLDRVFLPASDTGG